MARRDLALAGFSVLRDEYAADDPSALDAFYESAIRIVQPPPSGHSTYPTGTPPSGYSAYRRTGGLLADDCIHPAPHPAQPLRRREVAL